MKVRFAAAAEDELAEAALFLELHEAGLVGEISFRSGTGTAIDGAVSAGMAPIGRELRRCHLKRFRYGLIYRVKGDVIEIVAVAHDRQKPEYWRDRID